MATFNAALFSMAPVVLKSEFINSPDMSKLKSKKSLTDRPKSILKQSPLHSASLKSKMRVSINLPDNEISILKNWNSSFREGENGSSTSQAINRILRPNRPPVSPQAASFSTNKITSSNAYSSSGSNRTVVEVLRELNADVLALQDVKAEEEKGMKPLSDLAEALGMHYVFAESWAPEYGNAILSKWPIKKSKSQKIFDESDFR